MTFRWLLPRLQRQKTFLVVCACALFGVLLLHGIANYALSKMDQEEPEPLALNWEVSVLSRKSDEVHQVFFVKVHKAASSTLSSLLIRFSVSRQLNVLFPRAKRNILSERRRWPLARLDKHPPSPPFLFDILCNHVVYDQRIEQFLPEDTVHVTILREPLSQVYSAFNYYRTVYIEQYLTKPRNFHDFVSKQAHYEHREPYKSFTNNRMSLDLGLQLRQLGNASHVGLFVKAIDDLFDLVLLSERFNESMILLKRLLRWTMKDVLYISINKGTKPRKGPPKLDDVAEKKFRYFNQFDNALYSHFSKKFDELVLAEGPEFKEEVEAYEAILRRVTQFCHREYGAPESIRFPRQKFTGMFVLQYSECKTMMLEEMELNERARYWQQKRMYPAKTTQP